MRYANFKNDTRPDDAQGKAEAGVPASLQGHRIIVIDRPRHNDEKRERKNTFGEFRAVG